jgi:hypothetical protein
MSTASSSIADLALSVDLLGVDIITLGDPTEVITSTSTATDTPGALTVVGSSSIAGLQLDVLGQTIDLSAYANAAPNTVVPLTGIVGLVITVNKQTTVKTAKTLSIATDAIDIDFTDLHLTGIPLSSLVSGDITIGESFAQVPEPAVWAEMLLGTAVIGGFARTRRRVAAAA